MGIPCSGGADHSAIEHQVGLAFETSRCLTVLHICHVYSRSDPGHSFDDTISSSSDLSPSDIVASTSGTCPGLTLVYSHLDIFIQRHELDIVYVIGPGHGAPAKGPTPPGQRLQHHRRLSQLYQRRNPWFDP